MNLNELYRYFLQAPGVMTQAVPSKPLIIPEVFLINSPSDTDEAVFHAFEELAKNNSDASEKEAQKKKKKKKKQNKSEIEGKKPFNFQASLLKILFGKEEFNIAIKSLFEKIGRKNKGVCGKILKRNDIGFKCLNCEMDPTCIICKECFEKGNHKGHRVILQQSCNGCCDCGDKEAWKPEGFCSDHKGFETATKEQSLSLIPEEFKINFLKTFSSIFFFFFQLCDDYLKKIDWKIQNPGGLDNDHLSIVLESIIQVLHQLNENSLPMNWLYFLLLSSVPKHDSYSLLHDCNNTQELYTPGKKNFPPTCSCTILENIFRYNMLLNKQAQKCLEDFLISLFSVYEYKQYLIVTYSRMFHFFFEHSLSPGSKKLYDRLSLIISLDTQLFTSEELSSYVIKADNVLFPILEEICNLLDFPDCDNFFDAFYKTFNHIKNICQKESSAIALLNLDGFISCFCTIVSKMEFLHLCFLEKSHVSNESLNEKRTSLANSEIWVLECSSSLLKVASESADKLPADWFQKFIRGLRRDQIEAFRRLTEKSNVKTVSTFHIPIERVLCQVIFAKFSLNKFVNGLDLNSELSKCFDNEKELDDFLNLTMLNTLRSIGFMTEIERNIWVNSGQGIKIYSIFHQKSKYHVFSSEIALLQMILPLLKNRDIVHEAFSKNPVFRQLLDEPWDEKTLKVTFSKPENEKAVWLFIDFIEFLCFLSFDQSSIINTAKIINRKEDEEITRRVISGVLVMFMSLHGSSGTELRVIKGALQEKVLDNHFKLEHFLPEIASFDTKTKNFKLKENETYFNPFIFYADKNLSSELFDKLHQKYSKNQEFDFINGNETDNEAHVYCPFDKTLNTAICKYLGENSLQFLLKIITHISEIPTNVQSNLIKPVLKLLGVILKKENEGERSCENIKMIKLLEESRILEKIEGLDKLIDTGFNVGPTIKSLKIYINRILGKDVKLEQSKIVQEMKGLTIEQKSNKERILLRQEEIKRQFLQKQNAFMKNNAKLQNSDEIIGEGDNENDLICVCCKEIINSETESAGVCGFVKRSNVHQFARFQYHMKLARSEKDSQLSNLLNELSDMTSRFWGLTEGGNLRFLSCYHYMHMKCFHDYLEKRSKKGNYKNLITDNQSEFFCPLCNRLSNILIPIPKKSKEADSVINMTEVLEALKQDPSVEIDEWQTKASNEEANETLASEMASKRPAQNFVEDSASKMDTIRDFFFNKLPLKSLKKLKTNPDTKHAETLSDFFSSILELDIIYWDLEIDKKTKNFEGDDKILFAMEHAFVNGINSIVDMLGLTHFLAKDHLILRYMYLSYMSFYDQHSSSTKNQFYRNRLQLVTNVTKLLQNGIISKVNLDKPQSSQPMTGTQKDSKMEAEETEECMWEEEEEEKNCLEEEGKNCLGRAGKNCLVEEDTQCPDPEFSRILLENDIDYLMIRTLFAAAAYVLPQKAKINYLLKCIIINLKGFLIAKATQYFLKTQKGASCFDLKAEKLLEILEEEECILLLLNTTRKCIGLITVIMNISELSLLDFKIGDFETDKDELNMMLNFLGFDLETLKKEMIDKKQAEIYFSELQNNSLPNKITWYPIISLSAGMKIVNIELEYSYKNLHHIYVDKKCDLCNDFPKYGRLCLCLICGSTLCSQQCVFEKAKTGNLNHHSLDFHGGTSVFIDLQFCNIIWVSSPMNYLDEPIYLDQYGQEIKSKMKDSDNFHLDMGYFKRIQQAIILNTVAQEICFKKLKTSKYFYDNYF